MESHLTHPRHGTSIPEAPTNGKPPFDRLDHLLFFSICVIGAPSSVFLLPTCVFFYSLLDPKVSRCVSNLGDLSSWTHIE